MDPEEDEVARAKRRSREWKARKEEFAAALAADADAARADRGAKKLWKIARNRGTRPWTVFIIPVVIAVLAFLFVQRQIMQQRVAECFDIKRPGNYGCADIVADSFWVWLLPSETAEELRAAQLALHP